MAATLGQMRAIALDMADVTGDAHIDNSRVTDWFNLELAALNDLYVTSEENYRVTKVQIPFVTLPGGYKRTYPVPSNLYRIVKLYFIGSAGRRFPMRRMNLDELDRDAYGTGWMFNESGAPKYSFIDRNLELSTLVVPGSMELWYTPTFDNLTDDLQTISPGVPVGHEDWVILGVAIRARIKEESDPSALIAKRAEVENRIVAVMSQRDQGEAEQVRDYYAGHATWRRQIRRY